jgi:hypothetical protein
MSVVIIHRDGWACCDSRSTSCGMIMPTTVNKIVKTSTMLIGVVGDAIFLQTVRKIAHDVSEGEIIDGIKGALEPGGPLEAVVTIVTNTGKMFVMDANGFTTEINDDVKFWASGCADNYVLGYLTALGRVVNAEDAESAIKSAARWDTGIDDRVQKVFLNQ